jgi:tRNA (guanine-N7-)-methyltransferase
VAPWPTSTRGIALHESDQNTPRPRRTVRSFVLREGRLTTGQQRAFETLWPRWGLPYSPQPLSLEAVFGNARPVFVEIGFGDGENLVAMARANPDRNYIGIEVHRPGVGHLLLRLEEFGLENVRAIRHDAVEVLDHMIPPGALAGVYLLFPDPWHKKRHHKRRILQPAFVERLARVIRPGGVFHAATDWEDYARHMLQTLEQAGRLFENSAGGGFATGTGDRQETKFERRGRRRGHGVWDLIFRRRPA